LARSVDDYFAHVLTELGRLGLEVTDVESRERPPNTRTVLSDLLAWMSSHPGKVYAQLTDWRALDLARMRARVDRSPDAKPRIEISAEITKMNNLSVRWHPSSLLLLRPACASVQVHRHPARVPIAMLPSHYVRMVVTSTLAKSVTSGN
jgi:hypothetical protein